MHHFVQVSFHKTRDSLVARPWVIDDLDAALEYFRRSAPRKAVMFCDNAGSDVILGVSSDPRFSFAIPFAPVTSFIHREGGSAHRSNSKACRHASMTLLCAVLSASLQVLRWFAMMVMLLVDARRAETACHLVGMLPLARELLKRGVTVVMAANERPSINDTTAAELSGAVQSAAEGDKQLGRALDEQALSVMSSGSDMPVIDLSRVRTMDDP